MQRTVEEIQADIDAAKAADPETDTTELATELEAAAKAAKEKGNDPKNDKLFSQAEVDKIVQGRLAAKETKHKLALEAKQAEIDEATAKVTEYDEIMKTSVAERIAKLDPAIRSLVEEKDPLDQYKWLAANPLPEFKGGPITPKPGDKTPAAGADLKDKKVI